MRGYLFGIAAAFTISLEVVFGRFALLEWGANSIVFILIALFSSSLIQLTIAGYSQGGWFIHSLRQFHTWAYTVLQIGMYLTAFMMFLYVTTTEANTMARMSIITSIVLSWILLSRKPRRSDIPWALVIFAACSFIVLNSEVQNIPVLLVLLAVNSLCQAGRSLISETHPTYLRASNLFERLRVTGTIMLITSFLMLVVLFGLSFLKPLMANMPALYFVPETSAFFHKPTFYAALFVGVLILPIDIYVNFRAANLLNAERALMMRSFVPLVTLLVEWPLSMLSERMVMTSLTPLDLLAGAAIIIASLGMLMGRKHISTAEARTLSAADLADENYNQQRLATDRQFLDTALEHFNGHKKQTAHALGLELDVLEAVLEGEQSLTPEASRQLHHNFATRISAQDALTGLVNKTQFMHQLKASLQRQQSGVLLYLDLNKFKPINDTYGHEAGDEALRQAAQRLREAVGRKATISRLGGDEFAILLPDATDKKAQTVIAKIQQAITQPLDMPQIKESLSLGVSIGQASYPQDGKDASSLLHQADQNMYAAKKS